MHSVGGQGEALKGQGSQDWDWVERSSKGSTKLCPGLGSKAEHIQHQRASWAADAGYQMTAVSAHG